LPDPLTPAQRSALMSRIRGKNTGPERLLSQYLRRAGVYFSRNARGIPGTPDIVFRRCRLAVFADGEFWHGRRFDRWKRSLSRFWLRKIQGNIRRDAAPSASAASFWIRQLCSHRAEHTLTHRGMAPRLRFFKPMETVTCPAP